MTTSVCGHTWLLEKKANGISSNGADSMRNRSLNPLLCIMECRLWRQCPEVTNTVYKRKSRDLNSPITLSIPSTYGCPVWLCNNQTHSFRTHRLIIPFFAQYASTQGKTLALTLQYHPPVKYPCSNVMRQRQISSCHCLNKIV